MSDELEILKRALKREKEARKQAEKILEGKSRELFELTQELKQLNATLEEGLTEKTSELKGVFENLVDAYVLMDLSGNVIKMNDSAKELFGYDIKKEQLNVLKLIYKEDYVYAMASFQKLIGEGSFSDYEARVYTKHKGIRTVHINASLILNKKNEPIAAQGIVRDITEQLEFEKQRDGLVKNLEKSNKELNDYAHIVSHDLKSPLRSMNALLTWLKEDYEDILDKNAHNSLDMLLKKVDKMDDLISGILKYSSIDKIDSPKQRIVLQEIVEDIIDVIHIPEHIKIKVLTELPVIQGDKFRLQQLFQNLLNNAVKYNDKEKGSITVSCIQKDEFWEFAIADNGTGISKKYHDKIFQIFQTLDDKNESTGVGLSIVKKIIDLYEGEIWLVSKEGVGTTFYFTLKK